MKTKKIILTFLGIFFSFQIMAQSSATISSKSGLFACMKGDTTIVLAVKITIPANHCKIKSYSIKWGDGKSENFNKMIETNNQVQEFEHTHQYDMTKFVKSCTASIDYNVELQTTNEACKDANDRNITPITFKNIPSITFNQPSTICVGETAKFSYKSCPNNIDSYSFDYGDGTTGTSASHTYTKEGLYQVKIIGKNDCGEGKPAIQTLKVVGTPEPIAKISGETNARSDTLFLCLSKNSTLTLDGKSSKNYTKVIWNITGSSVEYLNKTNKNSEVVSIKLSKTGNYTISLTVENECGKKSTSLNKIIRVLDETGLSLQPFSDQCTKTNYKIPNPNKEATYSINGKPLGLTEVVSLDISTKPYIIEGKLINLCGTQTVRDTFYIRSLNDVMLDKQDMTLCLGTNSVDISASIKGGKWDGKNIKTQDNIVTFTPNATGVYTLKYTVGTGNCQSSTTIKITVIETKPIISNTDICLQNTNNIVLKATPVGGTFTSADCPTCINNTTLNLTNYTKTLINITYNVTENGCAGTISQKINIINPQAKFSIFGDTCQTTATTKNQSIGASKYSWILNGKEISTKENTSLTLINGKNTVTLIAQNGNCADTLSQEIIRNTLPNFNINNPELKFCDIKSSKPSIGILTANPKGGVWDSSDYGKYIKGDTLFLESVKVGSSDFTYTIKQNGGCSYSQKVKVTIEGKINAVFSVNPCKQPVEIINTTTGTDTFSWIFENKEISKNRNLSLNLEPNIYNYTLKSIISPTCFFLQTITFTVSDLNIAANDIIAKKEDKVVGLTANPVGGTWSSISGCSGCLSNNIVDLDKIQNYKAIFRYSYTAPNNCKVSKDITLTIQSPPTTIVLKADFKINLKYCETDEIKPENNSVGATEYIWKVNNKIVSTDKTPVLTNLSEGLNNIMLIVANQNNKDSLIQQIEIIKKPQPFSITFDKISGCSPLIITPTYPISPTGTTFQIDWGDGIVEQSQTTQHTYTTVNQKFFLINATLKNECGVQDFAQNIQIDNTVKASLKIDSVASNCSPTIINFTNGSDIDGVISLSNGKVFSIKAQQTLSETFNNTQLSSIKLMAKLFVTNSCGKYSSMQYLDIAPACSNSTNSSPNNVIVKDSVCEDEYLSIRNLMSTDKLYWEINSQQYNIPNPTLKLPVGINYLKLVFFQNSKKDSLIFKVVVFDCKCNLPTMFTPNGDGWNDWFYITANHSIKNVSEFLILNRWGEIVFSSKNKPVNSPLEGWDGSTNGIEQPSDVYIYKCLFELFNGEKKMQKGGFSLIR